MTETSTRVRLLNSFLAAPHGQLADLAPTHRAALERDAAFYGHLAAWLFARGEVRDHQTLIVAHLLTSDLPAHRAAGWALLQRLPPHQVAQAVDHAKQVIHKTPRILKHAVRTYLANLERQTGRFDRAATRNREALRHLYATLRLAPGPRAQATLFADAPPAGSVAAQVKRLARAATPADQAEIIAAERIPYTVAVGALRAVTPSVVAALVEVMTPQEVINHLKSLQRHGALEIAALKDLVEAKIAAATTDTRVSTLKATRALANVDLDATTQAALTQATDARVAQIARIDRPTALFVDKSGSMTAAIELAKEIAALVSAVCRDFHVLAFDTEALAVTAAATARSDWEAAFQGIRADGGTSIGAPLAKLTRDGVHVEQVLIVTDGGENTGPFFADAYQAYEERLAVSPQVIVIGVGGYSARFAEGLGQRGLPVTVWEFAGDYYSLPNLLPLLALPSRAELVDEIMAVPLPTRSGVSQEVPA